MQLSHRIRGKALAVAQVLEQFGLVGLKHQHGVQRMLCCSNMMYYAVVWTAESESSALKLFLLKDSVSSTGSIDAYPCLRIPSTFT